MDRGAREWRMEGAALIFVGVIILFTTIGVVSLIATQEPGVILWLAFVGVGWVLIARTPYKAILHKDGTLEVIRMAGSRTIDARSITSVERRWGETQGYRIRSSGATIWFPIALVDSYAFFKALETINPSIRFTRV